MENRFIEIITKDGEIEGKKLVLGMPRGTQFCNDGTQKAMIPIHDISQIAYKKDSECSVLFFSGGGIAISEHEYNRLKAVLMGGEIGKQGGIL